MFQWQQTMLYHTDYCTQLISYVLNSYDFNEFCMLYGITVTGMSFTKNISK